MLPGQQIEKPITQDFECGVGGLIASHLQFDEAVFGLLAELHDVYRPARVPNAEPQAELVDI